MTQEGSMLDLKTYITDIPDFPTPGILFRDITPLLANHEAFQEAVRAMSEPCAGKGIDYVAAVEARGFIFGSVVAQKLGAGFIPLRKAGKLPGQTTSISYGLEYGQDILEVHSNAIPEGSVVMMVDDLLATGGTMAAGCQLIEKLGAKICCLSFLVELKGLHGREKLQGYPMHTVISYD